MREFPYAVYRSQELGLMNSGKQLSQLYCATGRHKRVMFLHVAKGKSTQSRACVS